MLRDVHVRSSEGGCVSKTRDGVPTGELLTALVVGMYGDDGEMEEWLLGIPSRVVVVVVVVLRWVVVVVLAVVEVVPLG